MTEYQIEWVDAIDRKVSIAEIKEASIYYARGLGKDSPPHTVTIRLLDGELLKLVRVVRDAVVDNDSKFKLLAENLEVAAIERKLYQFVEAKGFSYGREYSWFFNHEDVLVRKLSGAQKEFLIAQATEQNRCRYTRDTYKGVPLGDLHKKLFAKMCEYCLVDVTADQYNRTRVYLNARGRELAIAVDEFLDYNKWVAVTEAAETEHRNRLNEKARVEAWWAAQIYSRMSLDDQSRHTITIYANRLSDREPHISVDFMPADDKDWGIRVIRSYDHEVHQFRYFVNLVKPKRMYADIAEVFDPEDAADRLVAAKAVADYLNSILIKLEQDRDQTES